MSIARNLWYHLSLYIAGWQSNSPPEQKLFHMCQLIMPCHQPKWQQTTLLVLEGQFLTPEQTVLERRADNSGLRANVLLTWIPWTKKLKTLASHVTPPNIMSHFYFCSSLWVSQPVAENWIWHIWISAKMENKTFWSLEIWFFFDAEWNWANKSHKQMHKKTPQKKRILEK